MSSEIDEVVLNIKKITKIDDLLVESDDIQNEKFQKIILYNSDYFLYVPKSIDYSTVYCIKRILEIFLNMHERNILEEDYDEKYSLLAENIIDISKSGNQLADLNINLEEFICEDVNYAIIKDDNVIFNIDIDKYTIDTSLLKLKSQEEFSMLVKSGEIFGYAAQHYKIIVVSDLLIRDKFKTAVRLWLTFVNNYYKNKLYLNELRSINSQLEETVRLRTIEIESKNRLLEEERNKLNEMNLKLIALNRHLDVISRIDPLTKLSNRRDFEEKYEEKIKKMESKKTNFSIIVGDIDYFKKVNDTYGHECGDLILVEISKIFRDNLRREDLISRYGGEEFVMFISNDNRNYSYKAIDDIRKIVEGRKFEYKGNELNVTMSFGIFNFTGERDFLEGFSRADKALYTAKNDGKNKVVAIYK